PGIPPKPGKSFPSGHTANMFCLATVLTAFYRRRGAWFFLPAALVALSRVSTGSHWPSDVIFTAMLSILLTMGLLRIFGWVWEKFSPRIVPSLASLHPKLIEPA
ncbi:MAG: phosphatase PAP2 family protein, partial [Chthoniobacterales bacterium]|nr:phosphatase PAP2 family protein [Chthoniobacterales bacterium]